ncbi:hypothetical protein SAMN05444279_11370 [Ruegeria intermedia]|uniref:Uncharacterized protein n=1 Tax=Ruegeria intermedia TaxID=996115 RepID=A0A1M4XZR2_9RHOB|nr:hypothetical protein SAMN05444279_11370 [Ruegeria intermedia]
MKIIPLYTRLSSTLGLPCDFGKKGASLGHCSRKPQTPHNQPAASSLFLSAEEDADRLAEPGLMCRHHLRTGAAWLSAAVGGRWPGNGRGVGRTIQQVRSPQDHELETRVAVRRIVTERQAERSRCAHVQGSAVSPPGHHLHRAAVALTHAGSSPSRRNYRFPSQAGDRKQDDVPQHGTAAFFSARRMLKEAFSDGQD